jgi:hypothetical protein
LKVTYSLVVKKDFYITTSKYNRLHLSLYSFGKDSLV